WRDDNNSGNTLLNIFGNTNAEFAQIYCSTELPNNNLCKRYYQISDSMIINNIINNKKIGRKLKYHNFPKESDGKQASIDNVQKGTMFYKFFKRYNLQIFYILKEMLWKWSDWQNDDLKDFIQEFDPDIIFAPCYGNHYMLSMNRYVANLTNKPMISYISDDHYSLKNLRYSPLYWLNRLLLRANLKKTF